MIARQPVLQKPPKPVANNDVHPHVEARRTSSSFLGSLPLSVGVMLLLLGSLIYLAGTWAIIANTRLLNLLISGGIIAYHDRQAGFIEGVADHKYYLKAQDPVAWSIVALVLVIYLLIAALKASQFHMLARTFGITGALGDHARAHFYGLLYKDTMPFHFGDAATAAALEAQGAPLERSRPAIFALNLFFFFEVTVFALFALLNLGWAVWLFQLIWAIAIITGLYLWTRPAKADRKRAETPKPLAAALGHIAAFGQHPLRLVGLCLLSLVTFGLRDAAAYFTAMAFSSQNVLLNIDPSLMLVGVIAGYIASFIRLTPGGIGQFEWGFTAALYIGGVGLPEAATVALLVSVLRYTAMLILFVVTTLWYTAPANFRAIVDLLGSTVWQSPTAAVKAEDGTLIAPATPAQRMPPPHLLWSRALIGVWLVVIVLLFDRVTLILADLWLLESLQLQEVFWTNFRMGALLFGAGFVIFAAAILAPAYSFQASRTARKLAWLTAGLTGVFAGTQLAGHYHDFLPFLNHASFGAVDPVFGQEISFFVFVLPALWIIWWAALWASGLLLISAVIFASLDARRRDLRDARRLLSSLAAPFTRASIVIFGIVIALGEWLSRYELVLKDSYDASVFNGAAYIDVNGVFSTLGQIQFTAAVIVIVTILIAVMLRQMNAALEEGWTPARATRVRRLGAAAVILIVLDFGFAATVAVRDMTIVTPNQPVIQLPYIARHLEATRAAYGLDQIEEVELRPRMATDPLPNAEQLLNSPTVRNAPLWPPFVSYLEQLVDPQHAQRYIQTGGENMIYGPTLEIFRQEQQLRTYYDFLNLAPMRFEIDGEPMVFAASVRELPILEPQPWLAWWGQRFMLFTHGHGLVAAPVAEVNDQGGPNFVSAHIPVRTVYPELEVSNQRVYYGLGNASMAVSNVRDVQELDYPTEQGRAVVDFAPDTGAGVNIDSVLKRLVFGWRSGEFPQLLFSNLITPETRLHYYRQPLTRLARVAPFLFVDNNPAPAIVGGNIVWLINSMSTTDNYPYSKREFLGDKSISRSPNVIETRRVNYVEDSVKATIDAATGQVRLYKIADKPVINTWAMIYPSLFIDGAEMPAGVRQQLTYPVHLFHIQFDDLYIYYHMNDPMYFFNMEDMWDDADEVLGPILDRGKAITFSLEPQNIVVETGGILPASTAETQFALTMAFTPEGARNLRAMPIAYQDGEDYGRLVVLQVPKGDYVMGPEQADAVIDQDPDISEKLSWWNRQGNEVIRGHTTTLLVDDELLFIEPVFIRSQQNSLTQLKRVIVVLRGKAYIAETLQGAVQLALDAEAAPAVAQASLPTTD